MNIVFIILAYLIGSIPFGLLLTKFAGLGDIRKVGSGNIGATNVLRTGKIGLAVATLLLDIGKGALAVFIAHTTHDALLVLIVGIVVVLGHLFPVWLKFKGGKGVATGIGVLLAAVPWTGLIAIAIWLLIAFTIRISSLAALSAFLIAPIVTFFVYGYIPALLVLIISALVWWRHAANIERLLKGEEAKVSFKKQDAPSGP